MKFGILGAGTIPTTFMEAVKVVDGVECVAVGSRSLDKAQVLADKYNIPKAYGSYEEMLGDSEVEAVYVATPHSHHYEHMQLCIQHGKHILCEKAFTVNATQAKVVLELARKKNLFVLEGMWPRFFPMVPKVQAILDSGRLGKVHSLTASKCYSILNNKERLYLPELAGGALLDLGCYVLNIASMFLGNEVVRMESAVEFAETGVDLQENIMLQYKSGAVATLTASMGSVAPEICVISCEKGYIHIPNASRMEEVFVMDQKHQVLEHLQAEPFQNFQYEVAAMAKAVAEGKLECGEMSHETTVFIMEQMDALRKQWGLSYPCE